MSYHAVVIISEPEFGSISTIFDMPPRVGDRITLTHNQKTLSGNVTSIEHTQDFTGTFRTNVYVDLD